MGGLEELAVARLAVMSVKGAVRLCCTFLPHQYCCTQDGTRAPALRVWTAGALSARCVELGRMGLIRPTLRVWTG
eukprot:355600-Chlamydomonas_euryale.AAC.1